MPLRKLDEGEANSLLVQDQELEKLLAKHDVYVTEDGQFMLPDPYQEPCGTRELKVDANRRLLKQSTASTRVIPNPRK